MQVKLLFVTFYLNGRLHAVSIRKPSERTLNFWTVRFLKTESEQNFGFPHIHMNETRHTVSWSVVLLGRSSTSSTSSELGQLHCSLGSISTATMSSLTARLRFCRPCRNTWKHIKWCSCCNYYLLIWARWNSLPPATRACSSLLTFRRETKSHLFLSTLQ